MGGVAGGPGIDGPNGYNEIELSFTNKPLLNTEQRQELDLKSVRFEPTMNDSGVSWITT